MFNFEPTFLGHLASFYYVKYKTVSYFFKNIQQNMTIVKLLEVMSYCTEFEETPVRHNEDNMNEALAKICPYPVDMSKLDSPNLKTFLLF